VVKTAAVAGIQHTGKIDMLSDFSELGADLAAHHNSLAGLWQLIIDRRWRVIYEFDEANSTVWIFAIQNCRQQFPSSRSVRKRKRKI
jgi:hypothetical protein